jgi:geranylgeranyl reductase family protein
VNGLYDAVVIGAGPAGSAAAIALGRAGQRSLLLDRSAFPRDKPCGDLIGARAMTAAIRLGVPRAALDEFERIEGALVTSGVGALDLSPGSPVGRLLLTHSDARVVPRIVFDHLLVQSALDHGARFRHATVREVGHWQDGMRVIRAETDSGPVEIAARAVVIAGGYGCRVARDVAPRDREDGPPRGIATRGYFRKVSCPPDRIAFSLDRWLLPGYGWVFPLPDGRANVGVGALVSADDEPREQLQELWHRFTRDPASPAAGWLRDALPEGRPRTWPLDLGPRRRRLVADGLLVAGETAGLVGPLTGAGIAFALESGELAGQALADALTAGDLSQDRLNPYGQAIRSRYAPWLRAELLAQRFLSDPQRTKRFFSMVRPLPMTGVLGARLLLHLG